MKKLSLLIVMLLGLGLTMGSCANDDEKDLKESAAPDRDNGTDNGDSQNDQGKLPDIDPSKYSSIDALSIEFASSNLNDLEYTLGKSYYGDMEIVAPCWGGRFDFDVTVRDGFDELVGNEAEWYFYTADEFNPLLWEERYEADPWMPREIKSSMTVADLGWLKAEKKEAAAGQMPRLRIKVEENADQGRCLRLRIVCKVEGEKAFTGTMCIKQVTGWIGGDVPVGCYTLGGHSTELSSDGEEFYLEVEKDPTCPWAIPEVNDWAFWITAVPMTGNPQNGASVDLGWMRANKTLKDGKRVVHVEVSPNPNGESRCVHLSLSGGELDMGEVALGQFASGLMVSNTVVLIQNQ